MAVALLWGGAASCEGPEDLFVMHCAHAGSGERIMSWIAKSLGWGALGVALVVLGLRASIGSGTRGQSVEVTCLVCAHEFEGWRALSSNSFGGTDRDFCVHAAGGAPFLREMWTCPKCAYTGPEEAWAPGAIPESILERLRKDNPLVPASPIDPTVRDTTQIPPEVRWDLRCQVEALLGVVPVRERASTWLFLAWTRRFHLRVPPAISESFHDLTGHYRALVRKRDGSHDAYRTEVEAAVAMVRDAVADGGPLTTRERQIRLVAAAAAYKARGEDPDAVRVLALLGAAGDFPSEIRTLADDLAARIAAEKAALAHAVPLLEEVLRVGDLGAESPLGLRYLVGELYRKQGDAAKARACLEPLLKEAEDSEGLRDWVADALRKVSEMAIPAAR